MSQNVKKERFKKVPLEIPFEELNPLNVQCNTTKCEEDLHCFRMTPKQIERKGMEGICISCKETRVDFDKVRRLGLSDPDFLITSLTFETIRKVYWTTPLPTEILQVALDLGKDNMKMKSSHIISDKIGIINPFRHGITPYTGDLIYYAQHATGTCCRRCMEYWYKFPAEDIALTDRQINFSTDLINLYLQKRVPQLYS